MCLWLVKGRWRYSYDVALDILNVMYFAAKLFLYSKEMCTLKDQNRQQVVIKTSILPWYFYWITKFKSRVKSSPHLSHNDLAYHKSSKITIVTFLSGPKNDASKTDPKPLNLSYSRCALRFTWCRGPMAKEPFLSLADDKSRV